MRVHGAPTAAPEPEILCGACDTRIPKGNAWCPECGSLSPAFRCDCGANLNEKDSVSRTYVSKDPEQYDDATAICRYDENGYFETFSPPGLPRHDLLDNSDRCVACNRQL